MRIIGWVVAGLVVAAAAGAGNAGPSKKAPAPGSDPSCTLVSKADAEQILAETLEDPTVAVGGMCDYRRKADHGHVVGVKLYPNMDRRSFESQLRRAANMMKLPLTQLAGYGEEALQIGDIQIAVLQHGKAISVTHAGSKLAADKLEAFVRKALGSL